MIVIKEEATGGDIGASQTMVVMLLTVSLMYSESFLGFVCNRIFLLALTLREALI